MFLGMRTNRAVVYNRPPRDRVLTVVNRDGRIDEVAIRVEVSSSNLGHLRWAAGNWILMAVCTRGCVVYRAEAGVVAFSCFEVCLVKRKGIVGRFWNTVAHTLRARIFGEEGSLKSGWRFCRLRRSRPRRGVAKPGKPQTHQPETQDEWNAMFLHTNCSSKRIG